MAREPVTPAPSPGSGLRPEVLAFARAMHAKLEGHNHDRGEYGWRSADVPRLFEWFDRYVLALREATAPGDLPMDGSRVLSKAANVANLAMMIADVCGGLHGE